MEVTIVTDLKTGFAIFNFLLYSIMAKVHIVDRGRAAESLPYRIQKFPYEFHCTYYVLVHLNKQQKILQCKDTSNEEILYA